MAIKPHVEKCGERKKRLHIKEGNGRNESGGNNEMKLKWKSFQKKIEKLAGTKLFNVGKFKFEVWMLIAILVIGYMGISNPQYSSVGNYYEGPQMEIVGIGFDNQICRYQGTTRYLDATFSENNPTIYNSKWSWSDSSINIDPDEKKAGIPDIKVFHNGFGQVDKNMENTGKPIEEVTYHVEHDGKTWEVRAYLYYFKCYVTAEATGTEDYLNLMADEVDWQFEAELWFKIGINKWEIKEYNDEMWAGFLKVDVRDTKHDTDPESRSEFTPNTNAQLDMQKSVEGSKLGTAKFDDFDSGWKNPDDLPSTAYIKTSIDFKVGKSLDGTLKHPWCKWAIVGHVLVTHRFVMTDKNYPDYQDPAMNDEQTWLTNLEQLFEELIDGIDVIKNLAKLLIYIAIGFGVLIVIMIILAGLMRLGGKRR